MIKPGFPTLVSLWPNQCEATTDCGLRCMRSKPHRISENLVDTAVERDAHINILPQDGPVIWLDETAL